jgi:hypothetical protein
MAIFAVTFRIHEDATYNDRYVSVINAIQSLTISTYWDEPTSFFLVESTMSSADLANAIDVNSSIASKDLLLVINLSQTKGHKAIGSVKNANLGKLMAKR